MAHYENKSISGPTSFNFAKDVVDYWAARNLQAMLWISQDGRQRRTLDFKHFSQQSSRIASLLTQLGISRGDILLIIAPRLPQWWEIGIACLRSGIVMCPATTLLVEKEIQYRCQKSQAKIFVGTATIIKKFLRVRDTCPSVKVILQIPDGADEELSGDNIINLETALKSIPQRVVFDSPIIRSEDPALIFFTSGTSGPPKMVLHNAVSYPLAHTITGKHWLRLSPGKVYWNLAEQGWAKASYSFFSAWNCGAALFVHDDRGAFDPTNIFDNLHKYPITTLCAPPTAYRQMIIRKNQEYFKRNPPLKLEHCTSAGEPLNDEVVRVWEKLAGLEICDGYGQTETILICGNFAGSPIRPGSMGKPLPGVPLMVIDPEGNETATDAEGEIGILLTGEKSQSDNFFGLFDGYISSGLSAVRKTAHYPQPNGTTKTFYLTGDRATRDADGYIWFVGRADDVINSAGYRIGPFEVESTLKLHPAVVESAAVASPDPARGEVVKAFVVLADEYKSSDREKLTRELQNFCKEKASPYKYPRKIQFVDAQFLPKTISGKIKRNELKKLEWQKGEKSKL